MMVPTFQLVVFSLVNILLVLLLSPLLEGVLRKLVAIVHSRVGPPIYQPYLDILKLLGKEEIVSAKNYLFRYSAILSFAAILLCAALIPMGGAPPLRDAGEILVFIYVITFSGVMVILSGITSENPYGSIGGAREMMMLLTVEPVLVIALLTLAIKSGSVQFSEMMAYTHTHGLALSTVMVGGVFFLAIVAQLAKLPFDTVEADQEIMEGPFIEQSGPKLALFKWAFYAKELVFGSLFVSLFVPWPVTNIYLLDLLLLLLKVLIIMVIVSVVHAVNPRLRIDQAVRYFVILIFVAVIGLAFAVVGS